MVCASVRSVTYTLCVLPFDSIGAALFTLATEAALTKVSPDVFTQLADPLVGICSENPRLFISTSQPNHRGLTPHRCETSPTAISKAMKARADGEKERSRDHVIPAGGQGPSDRTMSNVGRCWVPVSFAAEGSQLPLRYIHSYLQHQRA